MIIIQVEGCLIIFFTKFYLLINVQKEIFLKGAKRSSKRRSPFEIQNDRTDHNIGQIYAISKNFINFGCHLQPSATYMQESTVNPCTAEAREANTAARRGTHQLSPE